MKNIIVPLDFSDDAMKGLELALLVSSKTPVKIQMVYVQKKTTEFSPHDAEEEYKNAERKFKKIIETYKPTLKNDTQLTYIIKKGKVYQEVVNQAQAFPDSIIVASTHGASGFEELFIGSNAYKIISATDRPVITIRNYPVPDTIKRILLPIDIVVESRQKVMLTAYIAQLFNAEIHVVSFSSSSSKKITNRLNAYVAQACNYLNTKEVIFKTESLVGSNPTRMMMDYAEKTDCDLISIINESGDSITDLLIGSEAQQMISKAPVPVLTIRAKENFIKGSFATQS